MTHARGPAVLLAAAVALTLGAAALFPYVAPFILAALLAMMVDPPVGWLCRRLGWERSRAALAVAAALLIVLGLAVLVATWQVARELSELLSDAPALIARAHGWTSRLLDGLEAHLARVPPPVGDALRRAGPALIDAAVGQIREVLRGLRSLPDHLFVLAVAGLTAYFFIRDRHVFARALLAPLPPDARRAVRTMVRDLSAGLLGFLRAQLLLMGLTAFVAITLFALMGVPYPWALGLLAGLLEAVPLLGSGALFIPLIVYEAVAGAPAGAFLLIVTWGGLQLLRQAVEPRLVGTHMGLHPATALAAMYVAVKAVGLSGVVLGPLGAVFLKAALAAWPRRCQGKGAWYNTARKGRNERCGNELPFSARRDPSADRPWRW